MTKITFKSNFIPFDDFTDFEDYVATLLGLKIYNVDLGRFFIENSLPDAAYLFQKFDWNDDIGWIQLYHKDSLDAKSFQKSLIANENFLDLYSRLKDRKIDTKIEMLSSDENDLNNDSVHQIRLEDNDD